MSTLRSALTVAILAGAATACGGDANGSEHTEATAEETGRIVNVEVMEMQPRPFTDYVNLTGAVAASRDVVVSAEESGVVREVYVDRGRAVSTGQAIARIDARVLAAQVEQARSQAELARENWERQRRLWEQDSIGSEMMYIQARQGWETANANARALSERLANATVRAPFAGVVEDRMVEVGTMVAPGAPVARIVDVNPVKVVAGIPERYAGDISRGAVANVLVTSDASRDFAGTVSFVGAAVDPASRTVPVEIAVPNPGGLLRPGMVAQIRIASGERPQALVVPQQAVVRGEEGYFVYVVTDRAQGGPIVEARSVGLGESQGGWVPVESGLAVGDRVVISGQQQVAAGDRVSIVGGSSDE